ncbi:hypothetical protein BCT46_00025 [Vibrio sp. 10N.261.46.E8]|uniref:DUF2787 family protein n=1 Tax=unclassified Vibrio TaxID=2614977 RepID=UPI0009785774|nr:MULTISPECIES: DUF2787 family protein [unclassified Vibrio]OMO36527.1 hypothetical protein BH584_03510 [Vibrio sp. 10N.261.45.E1]PMJ28291.1 hypothetical protein BCU27_06240 [Vibrio sp. 10N.286.45.B6]PMM91075.1 hypothetical protein BCT46_00025 [Vibrio sp. 10N.261.46.E8]
MHRNPLPTIAFNKTALPISLTLLDTLNNVLNKYADIAEGHHIIHFSNKHYTAEHGGYHPVEIALAKGVNNLYSILCIIDFSFNGYPYPILERDIEFDFTHATVFTRYSGLKSISAPNTDKLYTLWESKFIANLAKGVYNQVELRSR